MSNIYSENAPNRPCHGCWNNSLNRKTLAYTLRQLTICHLTQIEPLCTLGIEQAEHGAEQQALQSFVVDV